MRTALVLALCLYSCDPPVPVPPPTARECETDSQCGDRLLCTPGFMAYCQHPQKHCDCRPDHRRDMTGGADLNLIIPGIEPCQ